MRNHSASAALRRAQLSSRSRKTPERGCVRASMQPWLSWYATSSGQGTPSSRWISSSALKTQRTKYCWSFSLAKLMHSCSSPLCSKISKPNISSSPMKARPSPKAVRARSVLALRACLPRSPPPAEPGVEGSRAAWPWEAGESAMAVPSSSMSSTCWRRSDLAAGCFFCTPAFWSEAACAAEEREVAVSLTRVTRRPKMAP
mmetsp:Transcript_36423/g.87376  ORF Transcript_36423/g.87376 Transcript_36423/m.87376 type:complete len:201 (+) Transcript_36423:197-799(+)